ncbi:MAG: hypothetical protein QM654_17775 [Dysgonamonadaceae bacterium]
MLMNELLRERLIRLLSDPSQVTNEEMQSAYGCFMKRVEAISQFEQDYSKIYRILNNTRIELVFLQSLYRYEQGKKCPEICLSAKSIGYY